MRERYSDPCRVCGTKNSVVKTSAVDPDDGWIWYCLRCWKWWGVDVTETETPLPIAAKDGQLTQRQPLFWAHA